MTALLRLSKYTKLNMSRFSSSATKDVLYEVTGGLACITLNRPRALNALNLGMVHSIRDHVQEFKADDNAKVLCMEGAGEKAFCAGGDVVSIVKSLSEPAKDGQDRLSRQFFHDEYIADLLLAELEKPYVAFIDGITMGGGLGVSVHGRFRVATEKTMCAMPETAIGLFPDVGGSYFLPRLDNELGMYLALTGARLKGQDVTKAGIATHYIPSDRIPEVKSELADLKSSSVELVQQILDSYSALDKEPASFDAHINEINKCFHASSLEEIMARLDSLDSDWGKKTFKTMQEMSPLSMQITFRQLRTGAKLSLRDCLALEFRMTQHFMDDSDFAEGVRAKLIDKNAEPVWKHSSIDQVSKVEVNRFFEPIDQEWKCE